MNEEKLPNYLRIRPIGPHDSYFKIEDNKLIVTVPGNESKNTISKFTHIFDDTASQGQVFEKCCQPLVDELVNGVDSLLFCYGTTASGKSFTIKGPQDNPGLIPRTLNNIFNEMDLNFSDVPFIKLTRFCEFEILEDKKIQLELNAISELLPDFTHDDLLSEDSSFEMPKDNESGYLVYLSFYEIYNDVIYDLLYRHGDVPRPILKMGTDDQKRHYVKGLHRVFVSSFQQAIQVYQLGVSNLQKNIQQTSLNATSSRSHSFFCVSLLKFARNGNHLTTARVSNFTLADLAGSERAKKANTSGNRIKEGGAINNSLACLNHCLAQTKAKQKNPDGKHFISFNNSNLTRLFQPFLTGTGKVCMIITINPDPSMIMDTLGSLNFSRTAQNITINRSLYKQQFIDESKRKLTAMTQMWLQSNERWSSFAIKNNIPPIEESVEADQRASISNISLDASVELPSDSKTMELVIKERELAKANEIAEEYEKLLEEVNQENEERFEEWKKSYTELMEQQIDLMKEFHRSETNKLSSKIEILEKELMDNRVRVDDINNKDQKCIVQMDNFKNELEEAKVYSAVSMEKGFLSLKEHIEKLEEKIEKMEKLTQDTKSALDVKVARICELEAEIKDKDLAVSKLQSSTDDATSALEKMEKLTQDTKAVLDVKVARIRELEAEVKEKELIILKLQSTAVDAVSANDNIEKMEKLIQETRTALDAKVARICELEAEVKEKESTISKLQSTAYSTTSALEEAKFFSVESIEKGFLSLKEHIEKLEEKVEKMEKLTQDTKSALDVKEARICELKAEIKDKDLAVSKLQSSTDDATSALEKAKVYSESMEKRFSSLNEHIEKLEEKIEKMEKLTQDTKSALDVKVARICELELEIKDKDLTVSKLQSTAYTATSASSSEEAPKEFVEPRVKREVTLHYVPPIVRATKTNEESPSSRACREYLDALMSENKKKKSTRKKPKISQAKEECPPPPPPQEDDLLYMLETAETAPTRDDLAKSSKRRKLVGKPVPVDSLDISAEESGYHVGGRSLRPRKRAQKTLDL